MRSQKRMKSTAVYIDPIYRIYILLLDKSIVYIGLIFYIYRCERAWAADGRTCNWPTLSNSLRKALVFQWIHFRWRTKLNEEWKRWTSNVSLPPWQPNMFVYTDFAARRCIYIWTIHIYRLYIGVNCISIVWIDLLTGSVGCHRWQTEKWHVVTILWCSFLVLLWLSQFNKDIYTMIRYVYRLPGTVAKVPDTSKEQIGNCDVSLWRSTVSSVTVLTPAELQ